MSSASIKKIIPCKKEQLVEMVLDIEKYPDASAHPRVTCSFSFAVRTIVIMTTIGSIVCAFKREQQRIE